MYKDQTIVFVCYMLVKNIIKNVYKINSSLLTIVKYIHKSNWTETYLLRNTSHRIRGICFKKYCVQKKRQYLQVFLEILSQIKCNLDNLDCYNFRCGRFDEMSFLYGKNIETLKHLKCSLDS